MTHLLLRLILCLLIKEKTQVFGNKPFEMPNDDRAQIMCTVALLGKYFRSSEALSGAVLQMSITSASMTVQQSLLAAMHTDPNHPWSVVVTNTRFTSNIMEESAKQVLHEKPQCYFFVLETFQNEDLNEIIENWKMYLNWNPLSQFVVYYAKVEDTAEEMTRILLNFMEKKIYNINIVGHSKKSGLYFGKTVFPYHPDNNCGNRVIKMETLDVCGYQESEGRKNYEDAENEVEDQKPPPKNKEVGEADYKISDDVLNATEQKEIFQNSVTIKLYDLENSQTAEDEVLEHKNVSDLRQLSYRKLYVKELHRASIFDKFPKDLNGCPLAAAYRPWIPYIFEELLDDTLHTVPAESGRDNETTYNHNYGEEDKVDANNSDDNPDSYLVYDKQLNLDMIPESTEVHLSGIEYKLIQTIAERLHINIQLQMENNNLYHLFQKLIDGDIEIVLGGIDEDPSISPFVSSTVPYYQDDLTWCVSKAKQTQNLFNFVASFHAGAWLFTFLFILTASLCILMSQQRLKLPLRFCKNFFHINVCVMGIILNQAIHLRPIPTSLKMCFGTIFFMGLMFSNIYQSFLVSTLTTPKTLYQISNLNEIYQSRMHIMGSVDNVRHLSKKGEIYSYMRENFQICYNIEECLQHAAENTNLAVAVSRQHYFYNPRIPRDNLYCFDRNENIYAYLVTMLMPKKFHLLHKINPVIQHIIESGHIEKWGRDLDMRRKIKEEMQRARQEYFKSLTLSEVAGSFAFNGFLMLFALLMFVMECTVYWLVVQRRTRLKFVKYIHKKLA